MCSGHGGELGTGAGPLDRCDFISHSSMIKTPEVHQIDPLLLVEQMWPEVAGVQSSEDAAYIMGIQ